MFAVDAHVAQLRYRQFMDDNDEERDQAFAKINPNDTRILGCDEFVANINALAWRPKSHKTVEAILCEVCDLFGVSVQQLQAKSGARPQAKARAWVAHQCVTLRIASVSAVAKQLGRNESTLRECVNRYFQIP